LTWTLFQELKAVQRRITGRDATNFENSIMGCIASGTTVSIMIPMDTIKTRLVTQSLKAGSMPYKGIVDCAVRVAREEGVKAFYKGLPPRLVSVVPMIGIQFTVYEFMKKVMQKRALAAAQEQRQQQQPALAMKKQHTKKQGKNGSTFDPYSSSEILQESCMEVAASQGHPYPAPHFLRKQKEKNGAEKISKKPVR
jgi:Mitochondrial carrier protein